MFEPLAKMGTSEASQEFFYCTRAGTNAKGEYTEEGFVVLKGSRDRPEISNGFIDHSFAKRRADLIQQGKALIEGGALVFKEDVLFSSPSGASAVVCGAASNGWKDWKNEKGITLHELKRGNAPALGACRTFHFGCDCD